MLLLSNFNANLKLQNFGKISKKAYSFCYLFKICHQNSFHVHKIEKYYYNTFVYYFSLKSKDGFSISNVAVFLKHPYITIFKYMQIIIIIDL